MADWIFLDNHTRTRPNQKLIDQMAREMRDHWQMAPVQKIKEKMGAIIGSKNPHVYLTSGNGENTFHVLFSHYMEKMRQTGRTHILTPETEYPMLEDEIKRLEKFDVQAKVLPVNAQGQLTASALQSAIRARSSILSLSWAHPLTGIIQPIHDLIALCRQNDMEVHLDISSCIGKLYLLGVDADYITFDGQLFHCPGQMGAIMAKDKVATASFREASPSYAQFMTLATALELAQDVIDHYAMEVGRLRDLLEEKMSALGGHVFFQEVERLPNCGVVAFEGIHAEVLLLQLKKLGIFATTGQGKLAEVLASCQLDPYLAHCAVSFSLSDETTQEEIERLAKALAQELPRMRSKGADALFSPEDAQLKNMRVVKSAVGDKEEGVFLELSLLVDNEDGVIADCKFDLFGPPSLSEIAAVAMQLLLRKNYLQAKRLTADMIETKLNFSNAAQINLLIDAIDSAVEECIDISIEDIYTAPPEMDGGQSQIYPNWEKLSDAQKKSVIAEVVEKEISPYVELDAGGVEVVKVEGNRVLIAYSGNCTSCFSATGATLDAIGNILRHKVYPELVVEPDMSLLNFS